MRVWGGAEEKGYWSLQGYDCTKPSSVLFYALNQQLMQPLD